MFQVKVITIQPSSCDLDLLEKLTAFDEKLTIIKDMLVSTQTTIRDIHDISKKTGSDVSKIRVKLQRTTKNAVKTFREVHDRIHGIFVTINASFDHLKDAISNALTYFLHH